MGKLQSIQYICSGKTRIRRNKGTKEIFESLMPKNFHKLIPDTTESSETVKQDKS